MDLSQPAAVRAAHYREQAAKLTEMAEAESVIGFLRDDLLRLAKEYQDLADSLSEGRR